MVSRFIFQLLLTVLFCLILNVNSDDYMYHDYMPDYLYDQRQPPLRYFAEADEENSQVKVLKKRIRKVRRKDDIYADLVDPKLSVNEVTARLPTKVHRNINSRAGGVCRTSSCFACLDSCKWLKKSRYSALDITQYTYLRLCSEGCKDNLACLNENYCLPVMEENPDYFVLCANKCNLFEVIPQVFRTGQCD